MKSGHSVISIFLSTIIALSLSIPMNQVRAAQTKTPVEQLWHTVSRLGHTYDIYKVVDDGEIIALFAKDGTNRVDDAALELLLVYDAATIDVPEEDIYIPGLFEATTTGFLTWDNYSWIHDFIFQDGGDIQLLRAPAFMFFGGSDYVENNLWHAGCILPFVCKGLDNDDHHAKLYADIILSSILQSVLTPEANQISLNQARTQLDASREHFKYDQDVVEVIDMLLSENELIIEASKIGNVKTSFMDIADHSLGRTATLINTLAFAMETADLSHSISAHNFLSALQFQNMLSGVDQRLADLTWLLCNYAYCSQAQRDTNPMIDGLEIARERFEDLVDQNPHDLVQLLEDPEIAVNAVQFTGKGLELTIQVLEFLHIVKITATGSVLIGLGMHVVEEVIVMNIQFQAGQDELRRLILSYNLFRYLRNCFDSVKSDRRYALSLLNMAYYSLYAYFYKISERAGFDLTPPYSYDPVDGWIFENPMNGCYDYVTVGDCTRNLVAAEAEIGRDLSGIGYQLTQFGNYLDIDQRETLKDLILTRSTEPTLTYGKVFPESGVASDNYEFSVVYTDSTNAAPDEIALVLDSTVFPMLQDSDTYLVGATYSSLYTGFSIGIHQYYFQARKGTINIRYPQTGFYSFTVATTNIPPSITLFTPNNESTFRYFRIEWNDYDPDDQAIIRLGYDLDGYGCDGVPILNWWNEEWSENYYLWREVPMTGGPYWVYATIDDDHHAPICRYSPGTLSIEKPIIYDGFNIDRVTIDDSNEGNGDGIWGAGEVVTLLIYITNTSTYEFTDVYGIIRAYDGGIRLIDEGSPIWGSTPGITRSGEFVAVSISRSTGIFAFDIDIYFRQGEGELNIDTETFFVSIAEPGAEPNFIISHIDFEDSDLTKADGDGILESGEDDVLTNVELTNTGSVAGTNIEAVISQPNGWTRFWGQNERDYPDILPGASEWPVAKFRIDDIPPYFSGEVISQMTIYYGQDREYSKTISVPITIQATPRLLVDSPYYAFGVVTPGTIVSHDFTVQNLGSAVAYISSITGSHPDVSFNNVPVSIDPGTSATFTMNFNTTDIDATVVRSFTINSDAHQLSKNTGEMSGTVHSLQPASYQMLINISEETGATHIGTGDIDGDGLLEIILGYELWAYLGGDYTRIVVKEQDSPNAITFSEIWNSGISLTQVAGNMGSMEISDLDGDNMDEIVIVTNSVDDVTHRIYYLDSTGNNTLSIIPIASSASYKYSTVTVGDSDNDGVKEIIVGESSSSTSISRVEVYEYSGGVSFSLRWSSPFIAEFGSTIDGDIVCGLKSINTDSDSQGEIQIGTAGGQLIIYESTGNNAYSNTPRFSQQVNSSVGGTNDWCDLEVYDLDNDLHPNIVYVNTDSDMVWMYESTTDNTWTLTWNQVVAASADMYRLVAGDVDLDGYPDLVITYNSPDGVVIYENFAPDSYAPSFQTGDPSLVPDESTSVALRNLDVEVIPEILFAGASYGYWILKLFFPQDLIISNWDILTKPDSPTETDNTTIRATVTNISQREAIDIGVAFYCGEPGNGGVLIGYTSIASIAPNGTGVATYDHVFTIAGTYQIYILIDASNWISETNENNNQAMTTLDIIDDDVQPPVISVVNVYEFEGDGNGAIEEDEQIRLTWSVSDQSGISSMLFSSACTHQVITGEYQVIMGPCDKGSQAFQIIATDDDNSQLSSSHNGFVQVVAGHVTPTEIDPQNGETNVNRNVVISVWFEEPIDPITLTSESFVITSSATGIAVPGSLSYESEIRRASFTPAQPLIDNTTYIITLPAGIGGIHDLYGNTLFSTYVSSFTIAINQAPNTPSLLYPDDSALGIPVNTPLKWDGTDPENDVLTYDVYIGISDPPTTIGCDDVTLANCYPGELFTNSLYYWYVVASDGRLVTNSNVRSFVTETRLYLPTILR